MKNFMNTFRGFLPREPDLSLSLFDANVADFLFLEVVEATKFKNLQQRMKF